MKKLKHETNNPLKISVTIDDFPLLEKLVEKLSYRRSDIGYKPELVTADLRAIETSSIEAYVSGNFLLADKGDSIDMPFTCCFFFTCIRGYNDIDKLVWSNSLS